MKMVVLGVVPFWILLLCFLKHTYTLLADEASAELLEYYNVYSKSVYFLDELEDVVYFRGSTIELHCHASCGQECIGNMKIYHNGSPVLAFDHWTYNKIKLTIKINNASVRDSGFYQCLIPVWPWTIWEPYIAEIAGRKIHVQITDLGLAEHKVKFISNGDSTLLPCAINASNNVYPAPDGIEWRKDDCHLKDEEDSFITQDNSLLITNITANVSYQCVVHWRDGPVPDYNGSYYQLVIGQPGAYHATVHPEGVKVKVGERVQFVCVASGFGQKYTIKWYNSNNPDNPLVTINHSHVLDIPVAQLNNSGSYYCVVKNEFAEFVSNISILQVIEPPHIINISSDVLINTSVINNVILNCLFTGDPTHTMVYWMKGSQNLTERTNVMNNTANLDLTIDVNTDDFMGSFQCVVTNEAGYVSRTTRVLPKGWTSAPRNVNVIIDYYSIDNCSIIVSWNPPVYNGGLLIQYCYKVEVNYYGEFEELNSLLGDCITATSISWDGCKYISEFDDIKFKITVVDEYKNKRSMVQSKKLTVPELLLNLMVNCAANDVIANWELTSYPYNIDEYCLKYWCDTVHKEMCYMGRAMNNASISGVPVHNTTCRFVVTAKGKDQIGELNSNSVMCRSPGVPTIVPDVTVDNNTININGRKVTLTLSWGEPFNNLDPIVNYTVSCSGHVTCPPNFTTTDNTTRSYTITNLTPKTHYTFSVVATNFIGSGEAGVVMITTPGTKVINEIFTGSRTQHRGVIKIPWRRWSEKKSHGLHGSGIEQT